MKTEAEVRAELRGALAKRRIALQPSRTYNGYIAALRWVLADSAAKSPQEWTAKSLKAARVGA